MIVWQVWDQNRHGDFEQIETVFFTEESTMEDVREGLIEHDEYSQDILLVREN